MRLVSFAARTPLGPVRRIGAVIGGEPVAGSTIVDLTTSYGLLLRDEGEPRWSEIAAVALPPDMLTFLEGGGPALERARQAVEFAGRAALDPDFTVTVKRRDVKLLSPLPRPRTLRDFSVYETHMSTVRPEKPPLWYVYPTCYKGNPDSVVGPEDPMLWPDYTERLDPELELAAVVGKGGRNLSIEEAADHIAGFTIFVDPSAREVQFREFLGPYKGKDFCTILGPCIVSPDEFDEMNARCGIRVNGEEWFVGNTGDGRHYGAPELLAYASDAEDIHAGDVIAAGTIGHGCSMDLNKWVQPGDVCEYWISGIGTITTTIMREPNPNPYVRDGLPGRLPLPPRAAEVLAKIKSGELDRGNLREHAFPK
jgi:2-keto-4-pentenoate hydratase/2-oxohepta-3-ene-1,7-dioic acid hydratase in catechol pathway